MTTVLSPRPLDHLQGGDQVARIFGRLTGRKYLSARSWLYDDHNDEVAMALRAFREADAWGRRESWAAPFAAELHQVPSVVWDDELLFEHHEADQRDDGWRLAYLNHRTTENRRQWCRALAHFQALNLRVMLALRQEDL